MSKLLSALFVTAMLGTTYGAYAGDGACNHAKKDVNAAAETSRIQLASGYPESNANTTDSNDTTDMRGGGNTSSDTTGSATGNRSGAGASGGTGSTDAGRTGNTGSTNAGTGTNGAGTVDNNPTGSGTSGSGASSGDM